MGLKGIEMDLAAKMAGDETKKLAMGLDKEMGFAARDIVVLLKGLEESEVDKEMGDILMICYRLVSLVGIRITILGNKVFMICRMDLH